MDRGVGAPFGRGSHDVPLCMETGRGRTCHTPCSAWGEQTAGAEMAQGNCGEATKCLQAHVHEGEQHACVARSMWSSRKSGEERAWDWGMWTREQPRERPSHGGSV